MSMEETMVAFITRFVVKGEPDEFERVYKEHAEFMRSQPGFVDARLLRSMRDPRVYLNIGNWRGREDHRRVTGREAFQRPARAMRELVDVEADLYEPVTGNG